jgi:hypothetical protein
MSIASSSILKKIKEKRFFWLGKRGIVEKFQTSALLEGYIKSLYIFRT